LARHSSRGPANVNAGGDESHTIKDKTDSVDQMSFALSPPVTSYSAPVTMFAASEARKTAARRPIERFAADILARRTKRTMNKAKKIRQLDTQQRHKLRIAAKKLRYASDFFGRLFAGREAEKRLPRFKARLTDLQDCLGALNERDISANLGLSTRGHERICLGTCVFIPIEARFEALECRRASIQWYSDCSAFSSHL
jgi:CHAD domain-containing protein